MREIWLIIHCHIGSHVCTSRNSISLLRIKPVFKEGKAIDYVVGHSASCSATLELEQNFLERNMTTVTYNAPVFEMADGNKWVDEDKNY